MRICRFLYEGTILFGIYEDNAVAPLDLACEAYSETTGRDLALPGCESVIDLLPPGGGARRGVGELARWLARLPAEELAQITIPLADVELLVPIAHPSKILLLAGNYAKHVEERGGVAAERDETFPYVFMKPPATTLTNPFAPIVLPSCSPDHVDWECELGVVIGQRCKAVSEADALAYVAGYTIVNDISDRKYRPNPNRKPRERDGFFDWLHGKWHDTFCPLGPCILSADGVDPQELKITLTLNGELMQDGSTSQMVFPVASIISFISRSMTLEPGDVISTGTPAGVGSAKGKYLRPGDSLSASIERIGTLTNPVVAFSNTGE